MMAAFYRSKLPAASRRATNLTATCLLLLLTILAGRGGAQPPDESPRRAPFEPKVLELPRYYPPGVSGAAQPSVGGQPSPTSLQPTAPQPPGQPDFTPAAPQDPGLAPANPSIPNGAAPLPGTVPPGTVPPGTVPPGTVPPGQAVPGQVAPAPATPSPATPAPAITSTTLEEVVARIKQIDEAADLNDEIKKSLKDFYSQARVALESTAVWQLKQSQFEKLTAEAPTELKRVTEALEKPVPEFDFQTLEDRPLAEWRSEAEALDQKLEAAKSDLTALQQELDRRSGRQVALPKDRAAAERRKREVEEQLKQGPPPEESAQVSQARKTMQAAQFTAAAAEISALTKEQDAYEKRAVLLPKRRDLAERQVNQYQKDVDKLRKELARQSQMKAEEEADSVWQDIPSQVRSDPYFETVALRIDDLLQKRKGRVEKINSDSARLAELERSLAQYEQAYRLTQNRVEKGTTASFGLILRKERASLPSERVLRWNIAQRDREIRQLQAQLFEMERRELELRDLESAVQQQFDELPPRDADASDPRPALAALLESERKLLDSLTEDIEAHLKLLVSIDIKEEELASVVADYVAFIDERVYWVRSTDVLGVADLRQAWASVLEMLYPPTLWAATQRMVNDARSRLLLYGLAVVALAVLLYFQSRLRRQIYAIGQTAARSPYVQFSPTLRVLLLTLLLAAPWPAFLTFLAVCLTRMGEFETGTSDRSLAGGLVESAVCLFSLLVLYQICRPLGLAEAHFRWPRHMLQVVRRNLRVLVFFGVPLVFLVSTLALQATYQPQQFDRYHNSLGRLCFLVAQLVVLFVFYRVFRPQGGVFQETLAQSPGSWLDRLKPFWFSTVLLIPVAFGGLAVAGFYDTALHLTIELGQTVLLATVLVLLGSLMSRWTTVVRRNLAIRRALEGRMQSRVALVAAGGSPTSDQVNLVEINTQIQKLIISSLLLAGLLGLFVIWRDVLPALHVLETVRIYRLDATKWLTLADLTFAALVLIMTIVATRNGPGLIEMVLLQRLPLHSSIHYAIKTMAQYAILVIGILVVVNHIGLSWERVVWLLAPLGVGLGFGLQEVFANFVCGIILLFEQPIRIGDIVTVGETTGLVTRIRIRATTIRNWDRQELVIPNKELITGTLINWTLTDTLNRIVINVGVAYGTDTERARAVLLEIVREHPDVLDDPEPVVTFEGFGDSTLNMVIRAYLAKMENRLATIHELHTRINKRFRAEQIEIAFPQRDIHVRSVSGSWPAPGGGISSNGQTKNQAKAEGVESHN